MEPASAVGLVASIIQLIDITIKVKNYIKDIKNADREVSNLSKHASTMLAMLTGLKCLMEEVEQTDPWFKALKGLDVKGGLFYLLREEMAERALRLDTEQKGGLKGKLTWKWNKKEMDGLMRRIERCKGIVSVALLGEHSKLLLAIKADLACMKEGVDDLKECMGYLKADMIDVKDGVKSLADSTESQRSDEETQKVCDWLSPLDFAFKQQDNLGRLEPGTGEWFLSDATFKLWLDGKERVLWCPGIQSSRRRQNNSNIAHVNTRSGAKQASVLYHAALVGDVMMVRCLMSEGARTDTTDRDGRTPSDWAKDSKKEAMVYLLTHRDTGE